jgi:SAM-dependent methyltransferase/uncharacterized protein YbaR (Trm112 family)
MGGAVGHNYNQKGATPVSLIHRLRFFSRKFTMGFKPGDIVLDVGSGNDPHPRADLLCDKFVLDDSEREGRLVADRPMVGGDLGCLPFRDQSIDFLIASHVLEHVDDPLSALAEMQRVAKRGYVETPAEFGGKLQDLPGHRWYVRQEGNVLVFTGKSRGMYDDHLNGVCFGLWKQDEAYMRFFWSRPDLFFVRHHWEGRLEGRVVKPEGEAFVPETFFHADVEEARMEKSQARSPKEWLKDGIRNYYQSGFYGPRRAVDLAALCACPRCKGPVTMGAEATCEACQVAYPVLVAGAQRVPLLLPEQAHALSAVERR